MKKARWSLTWTILVALFGVYGWTALARAADTTNGKAVFLAQKCNLCHSVTSQDIAKTSKLKGKELSSIATEIPSDDWLRGWLTQKELKDGNKHKKRFRGTDEELAALVSWILTLKS